MTKRDIKIEALNIAGTILTNVEVTLWDNEEKFSEKEQCDIVKEINNLGFSLWRRANKLDRFKKG